MVKLDIGCGKRKQEGFIGVDSIAFEGVDVVADLNERWPFEDNTVDEIHCSHVIEHFTGLQRVHVINEMYRVMKVGAKAAIIVPYWSSGRAYGDFTHQWPPVSDFWFYYLDRNWRLGNDTQPGNAPHTDVKFNPQGYACDFEATWGYGIHPEIQKRNTEFQQFATNFYKEAVQDLYATLTRR
jgi:SAM-dependent methyltransferase